jgi:hypothetical protein
MLLSDYVDEETHFGSESYVRRDVTAQCRDQRDPFPTRRPLKRLMILMLLALSAAPAYGEWVMVNTNVEAGQTVYFDPDTIHRKGNLVQMWALYDHKMAQSTAGDTFLSRKVQNEYDCVQEMRRMVSVTEFSGNMASGKVVHMTSSLFSTPKWIPARAGLGERLLKVACGQK